MISEVYAITIWGRYTSELVYHLNIDVSTIHQSLNLVSLSNKHLSKIVLSILILLDHIPILSPILGGRYCGLTGLQQATPTTMRSRLCWTVTLMPCGSTQTRPGEVLGLLMVNEALHKWQIPDSWMIYQRKSQKKNWDDDDLGLPL